MSSYKLTIDGAHWKHRVERVDGERSLVLTNTAERRFASEVVLPIGTMPEGQKVMLLAARFFARSGVRVVLQEGDTLVFFEHGASTTTGAN